MDDDDKNVDALNIELATKKAQLEMNMHTNAGVVEMYERRQAEVCQLRIALLGLFSCLVDCDTLGQDRERRRKGSEVGKHNQEVTSKHFDSAVRSCVLMQILGSMGTRAV